MLTRDVADGIHLIQHAYTNAYLVEGGGEVMIVDTGLPAAQHAISSAVRSLGYGPGSVSAIVLTHGHFDHTGTAAKLRTEFRAPILAHPADHYIAAHPYRYAHERPRLEYPVRFPAALRCLGAMTLAGAWMVRGVSDVLELAPDSGATLPGAPDLLATPGHTAGHVALHFPERGAVICGDALVTLNPYTGQTGPQIVSGAATANSAAALDSLQVLAGTGAPLLLPGHGDPWTQGAEAAVEQALAKGAS
ncbi:MBL fold metallo-hydrolase [Arthrobacter sp. zg-Y916]|uniref:MBL fold metallo-hydrolase n=1 Tax=Arthrobacter caoxuetaonis TaxID=2886935 RepID=A0A9X1MAI2_9MICC|nr:MULTISPECIES: MBL fold metallo-hydrolase [Arthrobacter]MCC3296478.1 MBL fold metallo-hydrolase [Arthrobacter caoxuetaonis]MCC9192554.1 MBL fold metallo-hydrolase [Arthrobacter sp. zg-Y916]USQ56688.1 MBL fold metallo-hydrolase [Arthrobacter caoxuetaonis]